MNEPHVRKGYTIGRDEAGLTARDRQVLEMIRKSGAMQMAGIGREIGVTKQRVKQIVDRLTEKGFLIRQGDDVYVRLEGRKP